MTKYILHGGFTREENESNSAFWAEFLKDTPHEANILLVYFASRSEKDFTNSSKSHIKILNDQSPEKKLNITIATKENFLKELKQSDAIFFNGGSTNKLLAVLKTYPDLRPLVKDKTIAGSSAGAYILATLGTSHAEGTTREGLGFTPLRVVCHSESTKLPPSPVAIKALENTRQDLELIYLKDYEWRAFTYQEQF